MSAKVIAKATRIVADCPKCGDSRAADVVARHTDRGGDEHFDWATEYRIIRCCGCSYTHFQIVETNSEDYSDYLDETGEPQKDYNEKRIYWPPLSKRPPPEWLGGLSHSKPKLGDLLHEMYQAFDSDMPVLAAIGMRTVFDHATEVLKIDPALSFGEKLEQLVSKGEISGKDARILGLLTDAGSAAAHRGWKPTATQLTTMALILESFLHRVFVVEAEVRELRKAIPRRHKRRKKTKRGP